MDVEMKYKDLADRVLQLLDKQKQYFKTRNKVTLAECRNIESALYATCKNIVYGTHERSAAAVSTLFGVSENEHGMTTKDFLT